ncbi:polysaccharide pyruvyl transferase family protein [Pontiellaceae bacterium B12219]|nr:polysaccharide pyruvyl transferase family protein [Pontiellaceae bacterium B12219]
MKIGIITFHRVLNYGAVLQAYALCEALKSLGHDPFLIDYEPEALRRIYRNFPIGRLFFTPAQISYLLRWRRFNSFFGKNLVCSPRSYHQLAELEENPPEADAYICGSDQIWCPKWLGERYDPAFFLRFGKVRKRISYAASTGDVGQLADTEEFSSLISKLDHISVREESSIAFVEKAGGQHVRCVIDPVFLKRDYSELYKGERFTKDYVLIFSLNNFELLERAANAVLDNLGIELRRITRDWKFWEQQGRSEFAVSPERWVACFRNARAVVTDSFHGTSFAILFHVPFLSVLPNHTQGGSHRILDLLQKLGLEARVVYKDDSSETMQHKMQKSIDWEEVDLKLDMLREEAINFLQSSLNEGGQG